MENFINATFSSDNLLQLNRFRVLKNIVDSVGKNYQ